MGVVANHNVGAPAIYRTRIARAATPDLPARGLCLLLACRNLIFRNALCGNGTFGNLGAGDLATADIAGSVVVPLNCFCAN
jgi:hypothetical protein